MEMMIQQERSNYCNNCGKDGHKVTKCKLPIVSYGIILIRKNSEENQFEYLMISRKNSFGFIDLIRGKYQPYQLNQLQNIIDEMTNEEKKNIQIDGFDKLRSEMWGESYHYQYKNEALQSNKKFDYIKNGFYVNDEYVSLHHLVLESKSNWDEPEWEFPKGKKMNKETDIQCAYREFTEETGIQKDKFKIIENVLPFEETFIGTNYKSYKHKYYLAILNNLDNELNLQHYQKSEVSKLEWKTLSQCEESIRPYHIDKKNMIMKIESMMCKYNLCTII
jgi:8-oxo-dGTP pyrophosphatase MutT (NUDIX family)